MFQTVFWNIRTDGVCISKFKRNVIWQAWGHREKMILTCDEKRDIWYFLLIFFLSSQKKHKTIFLCWCMIGSRVIHEFFTRPSHVYARLSVRNSKINLLCEKFLVSPMSCDKIMSYRMQAPQLFLAYHNNKSFFFCLWLWVLWIFRCCIAWNAAEKFGFNLLNFKYSRCDMLRMFS